MRTFRTATLRLHPSYRSHLQRLPPCVWVSTSGVTPHGVTGGGPRERIHRDMLIRDY